MKSVTVSPRCDQIEVSLFGPGYGECILLHIGNGNWVIVDSCVDEQNEPAALGYLRDMRLDPAEVVRLIVTTHWHDDHIRGMGRLVEVCSNARFCAATVLDTREFLTAVGAMSRRPAFQAGSGINELYKVHSLLKKRSSQPVWAIANRRLFKLDNCEIWSLSPSDSKYAAFLQSIGKLLPQEGEANRRIPAVPHNTIAVVLLIKIEETDILLGADLEGRGWLEIVDSSERPDCNASVFKVPHHGSKGAHEDRVWNKMLNSEPIAILTPWRRGGKKLPMRDDVQRIRRFTKRAYATASSDNHIDTPVRKRSREVERTIKEMGAHLKRTGCPPGMIRLRRTFGSQTDWAIETFKSACLLADWESANSPCP